MRHLFEHVRLQVKERVFLLLNTYQVITPTLVGCPQYDGALIREENEFATTLNSEGVECNKGQLEQNWAS